MVSLHRRVREEAPSHVRTEEFLHTLFRRCNKTASERVLLEYPYTRGSKTPLKKSFCFFVLFICGTVLTKVGPLPCSMLALLQAKTGAHFFDVAKKPLLSE